MIYSMLAGHLPRIFVLIACGSLPLSPAIARSPFVPDSGNIAIRCGELIVGLSDETRADQLVIIRKGRFERIATGDASVPRDVSYLNWSERTCWPGPINTHVHLAGLPEDANDPTIY
jgi:imidazolonepropionase-like amidohydrolase